MGKAKVKWGKLSRREGFELHPKAQKVLQRRTYAPGEHGQLRVRAKLSEYAVQLREKQRVKRIYGLREQQFRNYFDKAARSKGMTGELFLGFLERRLDNVVFRLGLAKSRPQARQLVSHGAFTVNGKSVNIPSYALSPGDVIGIKEAKRKNSYFTALAEGLVTDRVPEWLKIDAKKMKGTVLELPSRALMDQSIQEQLIVEFYSR